MLAHSTRLSKPPGQQLVDAIDLMICDAAEHVSQPRLRIDAVELGRFDQRVGNRRRPSAPVRAHKKVILGKRASNH